MENLHALNFFHYSGNSLLRFTEGVEKLPFWSLNAELSPHLNHGIEQGLLNASMTPEVFAQTYGKLGEEKWKEGIDGKHHVFGREVFDLGLHGSYKEPGFLRSLKNAFQFLAAHSNRKLDASFYLALHKVICGHSQI